MRNPKYQKDVRNGQKIKKSGKILENLKKSLFYHFFLIFFFVEKKKD